MLSIRILLVLLATTFLFGFSHGQKIGLVLSGGGASGVAHVGVLKALEENRIPIDYITGTSMGALVGALYASGYSPAQIEAMFTSDEIKKWTEGILDEKYEYYLRQKDEDASWVTFKLNLDTMLEQSLPTNLVAPNAIDFGLMATFSTASAACDYNFDNLFVPFRCVASDIQNRVPVIFGDGNISTGVRASISYPFFIKPIKVDGNLLFDGGLYNNFPTDIMCNDFNPDFVIGSNVSYNFPPPSEDDVLSQIKTILVANTDYDIKCEKGIVMEPETKGYPTFDFGNNAEIIEIGYQTALKYIDSIKAALPNLKPDYDVEQRRIDFNKTKPRLVFDDIFVTGINKSQVPYIFNSLGFKKDTVTMDKLKQEYVKLLSDDKIKGAYPRSMYNKETGKFNLLLDIEKEKDLFISFGGNFSSRPINEGFIGLQYNYLGNTAISLTANSYFGKFYSSALAKARLDFPWKIPFYLSTQYTVNKWDYFKSSTAFFEDVKPSYLVIGDSYVESKLGFPIGNKAKLDIGASVGTQKYTYYQTTDFQQTDTADFTEFNGNSMFIAYEADDRNLKLYPTRGSFLQIQARYTLGEEYTQPGSTAINKDVFIGDWHWYRLRLKYDKYFNRKHNFRYGMLVEALWSNQPFFDNYTASILAAPAFRPIPATMTLFQANLRAHSYAAAGLKSIYLINKNIQLRLEGYILQPYQKILSGTSDDKAGYGPVFNIRHYIGSFSTVYTTPIGPVAINLNYYHGETEPFSILFHFGYILFNKSVQH